MSNATQRQFAGIRLIDLRKPAFHVFRPIFRALPKDREGRVFFDVQMAAEELLYATNAPDALKEAKALGYLTPIVGLALPQPLY